MAVILQIAITQSISGTGALRIAGAFLERHYPHSKAIYLPSPTWGNHIPIFKDSGLEVKTYSYYDKKTVGLDFEGLKKDLKVRFGEELSRRGRKADERDSSGTGRSQQVGLPSSCLRP